MSSYSITIENPDGSTTPLGVVLGVSGDAATAAVRERLTRRQAELDMKGKVVLRDKNSGALFYEAKETPTVETLISP